MRAPRATGARAGRGTGASRVARGQRADRSRDVTESEANFGSQDAPRPPRGPRPARSGFLPADARGATPGPSRGPATHSTSHPGPPTDGRDARGRRPPTVAVAARAGAQGAPQVSRAAGRGGAVAFVVLAASGLGSPSGTVSGPFLTPGARRSWGSARAAGAGGGSDPSLRSPVTAVTADGPPRRCCPRPCGPAAPPSLAPEGGQEAALAPPRIWGGGRRGGVSGRQPLSSIPRGRGRR